VATEAGAIKEFLGDGIAYTRTLMADLRPDLLNEHDLVAGVQWLAQRMQRHGLKVHVGHNGRPTPLDADMLGMLFQSVRELLFNVVKHAGTNEVTVTVERTGETLRVAVADEGAGFDLAKRELVPSDHGGFGLFSIRERLSLLGGGVEVESAEGEGTTVTLVVPLGRTGEDETDDKAGSKQDT
jgi:signal transduction histidine kinase